MSMLAERRRKTKWVLNPTKKPLWTTDSSGIQFGKDLMEKMGWSAGKGLGAKEQGIQEPLRVSYKHDTKGIGFKGNDNDWIEQQDEFNELLKNLRNDDHDGEAVGASGSTKPELRSLEDKSKHSRARLHYQKLVRGKDLSKYSDTDLACILGINKKEQKEKAEETAEETSKTDADPNTETSFGVTTIRSGFIDDYFKKKYKSIYGNLSKTNKEETEQNSEGFTDSRSVGCGNEEENEKSDLEGSSKENKKRKKLKLATVSSEYETAENDCESSRGKEIDFPQMEDGGRKSKKRKHKLNHEEESSGAEETIELDKKENLPESWTDEEPKVKKRKRKNYSGDETNENEFQISNVEKNPCKADDKSILVVSNEENKMVDAEEKKSKRKKHKLLSETDIAQIEESVGFETSQRDPPEEFKKKHKHKHKNKDVDLKEEKHKVKKKSHEKLESGEEKNLYKKEEDQSICKEEAKDSVEVEAGVSERKHKKRKHKGIFEGEVDIEASEVSPHFSESNEGTKLKKKKSKSQDEAMEERVTKTCEPVELEDGHKEEKERKKKKKKYSTEEALEVGETTPVESLRHEMCESLPLGNQSEISLIKKKKKKKKSEKAEIVKEEEYLEENVEKKEKKRKSKSKDHANHELTFNNEGEEMGSLDLNGTSTGEVEVHGVIKADKKKKERKEKRKDGEEAADSSKVETKLITKGTKSEKREKEKLQGMERPEEWSRENVNDLKEAVDGRKEENKDTDSVSNGSKPLVSKTNNPDDSVQYKTYTKQKVLDLICWADIKEFRGSNLGNVLGYGFKKEYIKHNTVR